MPDHISRLLDSAINASKVKDRSGCKSWILMFKRGRENINMNVHNCDEAGLESLIKMEAEMGRKFVAKRPMNPWYNNGLRAVTY
jgi:hypothetical protein